MCYRGVGLPGMSRQYTTTTRRAVLRLSGAALAAGGVVGTAAADHLVVETERPSSVQPHEATLEGHLDRLGDADSADCYFEWGKSSEGLVNRTSAQTLTNHGDFSETIDGLESDTFYEYRAVAEGSDGETDTGSKEAFNTDSDGML